MPHVTTCFLGAAFPQVLFFSVVTKGLAHKRCTRTQATCEKKKTVVAPFFHSPSHSNTATARSVGVKQDLQNGFRLPRSIPYEEKRPICSKIYEEPAGHCAIGVVYEIRVARQNFHVVQTARCFNDRETKHRRYLKNGTSSFLLLHNLQ